MDDAGFALDTAYVNLLSDLTYKGIPVNVYASMAPDDAVAPYVILGPWQPLKDNTKDDFGQKGEKNVEVFTRFTGNQFSKKPASEIASQITNRVKPTTTAEVLIVPGFKCWNTVIEGTTELTAPTPTDRIFRKIITISHALWQI
ncbi:DUF3168 domain-containing protein [Spirosoma pollinicola]|uniref:Uncharacterized protein n=1 Tax=Spirosoma pollinicola TaxID=2057025 RepID=A0A2K8ZAX6_9BACT|nr:DUF3168 domain-containing protein [Spirosoma pollinicola]AUD07005.1 hypothetical protein CWM47_37410 [Spirosoma pollinicola]